MAIKPVSGEVKSQDINDNLSYLDNKVNQVSGGPLGVLSSESELKSKYPNGANGFFLINDDMWFWEGENWNNKGVYPVQGVGDKSLEKRKLAVNIVQTTTSDNLCRSENIFWGGFPNYANGTIVRNDNYCYVIAKIDPSKAILIRGTNEQGCFKDESGNYISGYTAVSLIGSIPDNADTLWQTFKVIEIDNAFIGYNDSINAAGEVIAPSAIKDSSLTLNKNNFFPLIDSNTNFVNVEDTKIGYYVDYKTGAEIAKSGYVVSDLIEIDPRANWKIEGTTEQLAMYDSFKRYSNGLTSAVDLMSHNLDSKVRYIKLTMKEEQLEYVNLRPIQQLSNDWIGKENALKVAELLELPNNKELSVKKDGTGNYVSLKKALTEAPKNAVIRVFDNFILEEEYSEEEIKNTSFQGYPSYKNQTVIGVGDVTISANLDPKIYSYEDIRRVSTFTSLGDGELKNLTIVGISTRYAFHPETYANRMYCENVTFIKKNTGTYCQAMAGGTRTGQSHKFKNCKFVTEWTGEADIPASYHTNNSFTDKCEITFKDCSFITNGSKYELRFGGMKSGQKNIVNLIGNRLSNILVKEEQMNGSGLDYIIKGRGNRPLTFKFESKDSNQEAVLDFVEDVTITND